MATPITNVTTADVASTLGRPTPDAGSDTDKQWAGWIADALLLIELGAERRGIDLSQVDQRVLDYVVRQAVAAQARRPDDATQVQVQVDDASVSRQYASGTGRVTILDDWWSLLAGAAAGAERPAYAVDTYAGGADWLAGHSDVCDLRFGAVRCSCGASLTVHAYPLWEGGVLS